VGLNRFSVVACLVLAFAILVSGRASGAYTSSTPPVEGCMNEWLSNRVWGVRVTQVQVLTDRVDVSVVVRNDTAKVWQPNSNTKPFGSPNLAGLSLAYAGGNGFTIVDYTASMSYDPAHPRNTHDDDPMMHRLAPGATYKTVLYFYYPQSSGFPTALEKQRPTEFWVYDDEVFRYMEWGGNEIKVKLNCTK
jgi:hypothetical protein